MIFSDNHKLKRQLKGIKQVLKEHIFWLINGIHLIYKQYFRKYNDTNPERLECCVWRIMSLQPDFYEQQLILKEAIIKVGYIFEWYLKFYYECNYIEWYWGFAKWETRRLCNYSFTDLLKKVLEVLINVFTTTIHKFACKS